MYIDQNFFFSETELLTFLLRHASFTLKSLLTRRVRVTYFNMESAQQPLFNATRMQRVKKKFIFHQENTLEAFYITNSDTKTAWELRGALIRTPCYFTCFLDGLFVLRKVILCRWAHLQEDTGSSMFWFVDHTINYQQGTDQNCRVKQRTFHLQHCFWKFKRGENSLTTMAHIYGLLCECVFPLNLLLMFRDASMYIAIAHISQLVSQ